MIGLFLMGWMLIIASFFLAGWKVFLAIFLCVIGERILTKRGEALNKKEYEK